MSEWLSISFAGLVAVMSVIIGAIIALRATKSRKASETAMKDLRDEANRNQAAQRQTRPDQLLPLSFSDENSGPLVLESIKIRNFKNIIELDLDLEVESTLSGNWTCIAGINGAGKSSILQAICLVLLGERLIPELGRDRVSGMLHKTEGRFIDSELTAIVRDGSGRHTLYLPLSTRGVDEFKLREHPEYRQMRQIWERLQQQVFVSYGATRNLSNYVDSRYLSLSPQVRRQMTLFDPLTQIANVDVLLEGQTGGTAQRKSLVLLTLYRLIKIVLDDEELSPNHPGDSDQLLFAQANATVDAIDLPDGFRSIVAWLADLCAIWHETGSTEETKGSDPTKISGIVLLDELGLHLHPSLERALVPRLRQALPNVQFIVTTHSPLVLGCFDRAELIVLDQTSDGGVKLLDRQIFGFSTNEIYQWLMDTTPNSTVIERLLEEGKYTDLDLYLSQSPDISADESEEVREQRRQLLKDLDQYSDGS